MISKITADWTNDRGARAKALSEIFLNAPPERRWIFGRNVYADAVVRQVEVAGFVDDFTDKKECGGLPIKKLVDLPDDAIVLACAGGRPLTARSLLKARGLTHLDYFSLLRWSQLDLPEAVFNEGFSKIVYGHKEDIDWVEGLMADENSLNTLRSLFSFRMSYDLSYLENFTARENEQYFEPFINYNVDAPVFLDVGGYDGFTTEKFIKRAPNYSRVHLFEPEKQNYKICKKRLERFDNVMIHPVGAGAQNTTLRLSANGSTSVIAADGEQRVRICRLDDCVEDVPTFIKMDIEGAEIDALEGARRLISNHHPALAICVYHRPSDFWEVPRKIMSMYGDYSVFLRHYTESIYETVMFFVPDEMLVS